MSHPTNFPDPNFPFIQLPTQFRARRQTLRDRQVAVGETKEVFRARGPGCVRHIWFSPNPIGRPRTAEGVKDNSNANSVIKIYVDDESQPLVNLDLKRLCGVLLDQSPYRVDNAGFAVVPRRLGSIHGDGFNIYLPIPFAKSCRITMEPLMDQFIRVMATGSSFPRVPTSPLTVCTPHTGVSTPRVIIRPFSWPMYPEMGSSRASPRASDSAITAT